MLGLVTLGLLFAVLASRSSSSSPARAPSITGLVVGDWYKLIVRSSLNADTFGDSAAQQAQTILGRQGFDARVTKRNANGDPYVYDVVGAYRGLDGGDPGTLVDEPGLLLLSSSPVAAMSDAAGPAYLESRPIDLVPGTTYYGRANVSWPASMIVTRSAVESKLGEKGFADVHVFMDPSELPAEWPATQRGGDVFASARFNGAPTTFDVPSQVVSVWTE